MHKIIRKLLGKLNVTIALMLAIVMAGGLSGAIYVLASSTSEFQQEITPGTLTTDIVDETYSSVANPAVTMSAVTFSFSYQTATGTFGTDTEQIYVKNPDAADGGWTLAVAPATATTSWHSTVTGFGFDFNDPTANAEDGVADADALGGQMTINPSVATLAKGQCKSCTTANISKGSSTAYAEGTTNSVTLLAAAAESDDIGDWTLKGVSISQTIPAEQPAADDYTINMVLTATTL